MLIPIVGPMVMFGYLIRRYAKVSEGKEVENFDSNFFEDWTVACARSSRYVARRHAVYLRRNPPHDVRACVRTRE